MDRIEPNPALEPVEPEALAATAPVIDRPVPLWRLVFLLALPVMTQQLLHLAVSLSDRALAGRFLGGSAAYQSAQTSAGYVYWMISSFMVLVSVGSTAVVARLVGGRDSAGAVHATNQSLFLGLAFGLAGGALGLLGVDYLIALLQVPGDAAGPAAEYLKPVFAALPLQMIEAVGIACLIGAGDTLTGMWVLSAVAAANVPLAWGFFHGWGPLPALGFVGISTGTAVSHSLGCLAVLLILVRGRAGLRIDLKQLRPDWPVIRRILRVSVPAGLDNFSRVAGQFWFLSIVNRLGSVASAAHGIALIWEGLAYMSGEAFSVAAMTLVGQNLGARRHAQAARSGWTAFALGGVCMTLMAGVFFVLAVPMFQLFCPHPDQQPIVDAGVPLLRLVAFAMPALAASIIFTGALRGAGDTRMPVLFTWIGFFAVRIPLAYWFTNGLGWGLMGAWLAMFADLMVRGVAFTVRFAGGRWRGMKV